MENILSTAITQNPGDASISAFYFEGNTNLQVNPLRLQPPTNIVESILADDKLHFQWILEMPWRIEGLKNRDEHVYFDNNIDIYAARLYPQGEDLTHNTIRIRGVFVNDKMRYVEPCVLNSGDEVEVGLFIGSEFVTHNNICCDFGTTNMQVAASCNKLFTKHQKKFLARDYSQYLV